jgi:hypothetical protein
VTYQHRDNCLGCPSRDVFADQIEADVASMTADGAYDGEATYDSVTERHPGAAVVIPRQVTAVTSEAAATQRDQHIATIAKHGRMG